MKFTKMQGLGNDYVYVNGALEHIEDPSKLAIQVSNRNFGVGSDGLICINPSEVADFEMAMYNADGSRGEMCGNGMRCVGKYVYDYGLTDKTRVSVETLAGIKHLDLTVVDGKVRTIKVDMGSPVLEPDLIPVVAKGTSCINQPILVEGHTYHMTCVSMGNPHAVVYMDKIADLDLLKIGPTFEHHQRFPNRVNTEFVKVLDRNNVEMRVWERGSGETLACGTGACAVAVASMLNGYVEDKCNVHLLGGTLEIEWNRETNNIYMTGPAEIVFEGELYV